MIAHIRLLFLKCILCVCVRMYVHMMWVIVWVWACMCGVQKTTFRLILTCLSLSQEFSFCCLQCLPWASGEILPCVPGISPSASASWDNRSLPWLRLLTWGLGLKLGYSCLNGKHSIHWVLPILATILFFKEVSKHYLSMTSVLSRLACVCVCPLVCVWVYKCVHACGGQRPAADVLCPHSPLYWDRSLIEHRDHY